MQCYPNANPPAQLGPVAGVVVADQIEDVHVSKKDRKRKEQRALRKERAKAARLQHSQGKQQQQAREAEGLAQQVGGGTLRA